MIHKHQGMAHHIYKHAKFSVIGTLLSLRILSVEYKKLLRVLNTVKVSYILQSISSLSSFLFIYLFILLFQKRNLKHQLYLNYLFRTNVEHRICFLVYLILQICDWKLNLNCYLFIFYWKYELILLNTSCRKNKLYNNCMSSKWKVLIMAVTHVHTCKTSVLRFSI